MCEKQQSSRLVIAKCVSVKLRKGGEGVKNNTQRGRILHAAYAWQVVLSMEQ